MDLISISLITNEVKHCFIYFIAIYISSIKHLLKSFAHFFYLLIENNNLIIKLIIYWIIGSFKYTYVYVYICVCVCIYIYMYIYIF